MALRWLAKNGAARDLTYAELRALTNRFASVLHGLGLGRGERVFVLAGRIPELYVAALGALKAGGAFPLLFSAFGPEPIHARLSLGEGKVLVTTEALYRCEVAALRDRLPRLEHVILVGEGGRRTAVEGTLDWHALTANASERFRIPPTGPEDMALLHFTSGTTDRQAQGRDPRPRGRRRG